MLQTTCDDKAAAKPQDIVPPDKSDVVVKVGAWYFGGWSFPPDANGYTFHISPSLVTKYSEREPEWGWREDTPGVMEKQIDYAANSGISFWGFCWYENTLVGDTLYINNANNALGYFLKSANKNRLDFCLMSCFPVSPVNWNKICSRTIECFKESNYLKVDKKPVMIFFNSDEVISGLGGIEGTKRYLDIYRQKARDAGVGEISIGARTISSSDPAFQYKYEQCGFDFLTTYHNAEEGRKNAGANDYDQLIAGDQLAWNGISHSTSLPFMASVGTGYDMRPWATDHPTIAASDYWYTNITPEKIGVHLRNGIRWTKAQADPKKTFGNLVILYAWNENAEGAWLTPTKSEGKARLDAVQKVINEEMKK